MFVSFSHQFSIYTLFYLLIYMVIVVHLSWKKASVYWSMSLVNFLLGGKENLITTVTSCLLGHHIFLRLWTCRESWLEHLCLLEHILSLVIISLGRCWCHRVFLCAHLDFVAGMSIVDQDDVDLSISSSLPWFILSVILDGYSCTY